MTGLEPHPILPLPTAAWCRELEMRLGQERAAIAVQNGLEKRARVMQREKDDPFNCGYEPAIWHLVDDLLVDGNTVVLDVSRLEKLNSGPRNTIIDVPLEIAAAPEVYIAGANRSSKSEYAAKKLLKVLQRIENARTWSFADTGPISIARQQPIFWKYMPIEIKRLAAGSGKARQGAVLNVSYKQKTGFAEQSFVLPNGAQHWFKNYEQDIENVEGDQLDAAWLDELRNIALLRTLRGRMIDRGGIVIVTFTAIDENYSSVFNEYERGARTVFEVDAELLPIKKPKDLSAEARTGEMTRTTAESVGTASALKKDLPVPVLAEVVTRGERGNHSGPCDRGRSDAEAREGTQAAYTRPKTDSRGGQTEFEVIGYKKVPRIKVAGPGSDGDQRANIVYFHAFDNPYFGYEGAMNRAKPGRAPVFGKERFYRAYRGATEAKILARVYGILSQGSAQQFPKFNDAVHVIDPARIPAQGTNFHVVDPCDGRNWFMVWIRIDAQGRWFVYREWPSTGHQGAYIPGRGDPGPWALPGQPADGVRGPAQQPFGFGLERYIQEILRLEEKEEIAERWMDSRYAANPTTTKEGSTTHIEQLAELGMEFLAASGKEIAEGTGLINDKLDYDNETELGKFSARLARLNEPKLFVSRNCPNVIYALREWTNKDKQHGACKDPVDVLRYATLAGLDYIGADAYTWQGGGSY
jgi:hypothetical protein